MERCEDCLQKVCLLQCVVFSVSFLYHFVWHTYLDNIGHIWMISLSWRYPIPPWPTQVSTLRTGGILCEIEVKRWSVQYKKSYLALHRQNRRTAVDCTNLGRPMPSSGKCRAVDDDDSSTSFFTPDSHSRGPACSVWDGCSSSLLVKTSLIGLGWAIDMRKIIYLYVASHR